MRTYEVRKNTGARCARSGDPEIGGLISKHRTLEGAMKSARASSGYSSAPIVWVRDSCDSVLRLRNGQELDECLAY